MFVPSIVLPTLILGEKIIPEILQEHCNSDALAQALVPLIEGGEARERQLAALERVGEIMALPDGESPSQRAARIVVETANRAHR